eukprot:TRINITY_DN12574_c4_g3_i1.p1 TRINITY_DN12574_c4_g3~~TRINITY_DN12574_c4_g3_i1.p1  ORF type:complete len:368 (+),score=67.66 TRINITY_DN12574_c4_g3_i1:2571-3674(+)
MMRLPVRQKALRALKIQPCACAFHKSQRWLSDSLPRVIMSGVQPTGTQHLGNYLGAIRQWVIQQRTSQHDEQKFFGVMDLHSITVPQDTIKLNAAIFNTIAAYLACGLDPKQAILFQQSTVPQHAELTWILTCFTSTGDLDRMTQWKSKSKKQKSPTLGLYAYPVLMAADVLLYNTTHVPVGEDQVQHLELTRDLAASLNNKFDPNLFVIPETVLVDSCRVRSLRKPAEKMSKSDRSELSRIGLEDDADTVATKIRRAVTDSLPNITYQPEERPGVTNLLTIYAALRNTTPQRAADDFSDATMVQLKAAVTAAIVDELSPIQAELAVVKQHPEHIAALLKQGQLEASAVAEATVDRVKRAVGIAPLF